MADAIAPTPELEEIMALALALAERMKSAEVTPEHILLAIIQRGHGIAHRALAALCGPLDGLRGKMEVECSAGQSLAADQRPHLSTEAKRVIDEAKRAASEARKSWLAADHLLLALIRAESTPAGIALREAGVVFEEAQAALLVRSKLSDLKPGGTSKANLAPGPQTPAVSCPPSRKTPFTPGMKDVMRFARAEAGRLNHDHIGPEHYLLGIIRKGDGLAIQVLNDLDVDLESLKSEVEKRVGVGKGAPPLGIYNPTAEAKKVIEDSKEIALGFRHSWIGTEHLLLGLIRAEQSIPGQELRAFGVTQELAAQSVRLVIDGCSAGATAPKAGTPREPDGPGIVRQSVILNAPAPDLFAMFLNPETHAAITGAPVVIGAEPGARFEAFNGALTGSVLQVVAGRRIVMSWRSGKWTAEDLDSTLILNFVPAGDRGRIDLIHADVPGHDFEEVKQGWKRSYWEPWMAWLDRR